MEARSCNHCCSGKAMSITYSECVFVALRIQHAKRMRRIVSWSAACLAVSYFSILSHKRHDFRKKNKLLDIKCMFWFSAQRLAQNYVILWSSERGMIKMCVSLPVKYPLFLSDYNETWIFLTDFRKMFKYQISWKSVQWQPSSMRTDRRRDRPWRS